MLFMLLLYDQDIMTVNKTAEIANGTQPRCGILLIKGVMKMASMNMYGRKKARMRRICVFHMTIITRIVIRVVMIITHMTTTPAYYIS